MGEIIVERLVRRKSPKKPGEMGRANGAVMSATKTFVRGMHVSNVYHQKAAACEVQTRQRRDGWGKGLSACGKAERGMDCSRGGGPCVL